MKQFQVEVVSVTINLGVLELNINQAQRRKHLLKQIGDNLYEVTSPVQFKRGEQFGYGGDVNKSLMSEITPIEEEQAAGLPVELSGNAETGRTNKSRRKK